MENTELDAFLAASGEPQPEKEAAADEPPRAEETSPAKDEPQPEAVQQDETKDVDPFADLPQVVKARLAQLPQFEHQLRSERGRREALERKLRELEAATPKEKPKSERIEKIRSELPEVADALEEIASRHVEPPAAEPVKEEPQRSQEELDRDLLDANPLLTAEHPNWLETVRTADFNVWLGNQPPAYRQRLQQTDSEHDLARAMVHYSTYQQAAAQRVAEAQQRAAAAKVTQTRQARVQEAVTPKGAGARRDPAQSTELDAFLAYASRNR